MPILSSTKSQTNRYIKAYVVLIFKIVYFDVYEFF